jgi:hypothetical protein
MCGKACWGIFGLVLWLQGFAQVHPEPLEFLEASGMEPDPIQWEDLQEKLKSITIYINNTNAEELQQLPFLDIFQIHNLLAYRGRNKKIYSIYELLQIKGFDENLVAQLRGIFDFNPHPPDRQSWLKSIQQARHTMAWRWGRTLEPRVGDDPERATSGLSHYSGSPDRQLFRYRWHHYNRFSVGMTLEKDPGEPFAAPHQPLGFDFVSAHAHLRFNGMLEEIFVGDFSIEAGQGLLLWNSLAMGKTAAAVDIRRYGRGLRAYTGTDENRFFRGAAASFRIQSNIKWQVFWSQNRSSATVTDSGFATMRTSGLHRTPTEIQNRHNLNILTLGHHLQWTVFGWSAGLVHVWHQFDKPQVKGGATDRLFQPTGNERHGASAYLTRNWRHHVWFGEGGYMTGRPSWVAGWQWAGHPRLQLSLLHRRLLPGFAPLYQGVFEGGTSGNRSGLYAGLALHLNRRWSLTGFVDRFRDLWFRHQQTHLGQTQEILLQLNWQPRKHHFYLRYSQTNGLQTIHQNGPMQNLADFQRRRLRLHWTSTAHTQWRLATRVEWAQIPSATSKQTGMLMFQEGRWQSDRGKWILTARLALFNTPDFATAVYAFEPDLPMGFAIPAFFGDGQRTVCQVIYKPSRQWELGIRYARTRFFDRATIGTGLDQIDGPIRTEIRTFIRLRVF